MNNDFKWNGEPCEAKAVLVEILPGEGHFKWWQPYVGKILRAIEVKQNGHVFYIYNGDFSGVRKLREGGGPNSPHKGFDNIRLVTKKIESEDDITAVKECREHEWSDESLPLLKTESKYCIKCRTAKLFFDMGVK